MTNLATVEHNKGVQWLQTRPGEQCAIRVASVDTSGLYSFVEIISSPGDGTPMHVHRGEDEHFFVLEGTVRIACGDDVFDLEAGNVATLRRGIPHAWGNRTSSPLRIAVIVTPGGCEQAMRIIAKGGDIDVEAMARQFDIQVVGPTPF